MVKDCNQCRTINPSSNLFCVSCGASLEPPLSIPLNVNGPAITITAKPASRRGFVVGLLAGLAGVSLIASLFLLSVFIFGKDNQTGTQVGVVGTVTISREELVNTQKPNNPAPDTTGNAKLNKDEAEAGFTPQPDLPTSPTAMEIAPTQIPAATPTSTSQPTNTPMPTNTPAPTNTPVPTATNTPLPTDTPVPTPKPALFPLDHLMAQSGTFFFTSFRNNTNEIYRSDLNGSFSNPVKVVPLNGQGAINTGDPNISPDGRFVAYHTNGYAPKDAKGNAISTEVYISPINDLSQRIKIGDGVNPSWSPDGTGLIWVSAELGCGGDDLIMMNLNLNGSSISPIGGPVRMTCDGLRKRNPRWSARGVIVFTLSDAKTDNINLRLVKIPTTARDTTSYIHLTTFGLYPNLSPDGGQIVFSSGDTQGRNSQIFVIGIDGGTPRQLTSDGWNYRPAWMSNNLILFSSNRERPGQTSSSIWVMDVNGTGQQRVPIPGEDDNYSVNGFFNS